MPHISEQHGDYFSKPAHKLPHKPKFGTSTPNSVQDHQTDSAFELANIIPIDVDELVEAFLTGKSQRTLLAYQRDLISFSEYLGMSTITEAVKMLVRNGHGSANLTAIRYKDSLVKSGVAPATVNRHLSALRSLVKLAQTLGVVDWELQVPSVRSESLRDTRGVGLEGFRRLLGVAQMQRNPVKAARDAAILRLLFDLGLRRSEVCALDLDDVDLPGSRVMVIGKGKTEKAPMTLPVQTMQALKEWIVVRGEEPGALFFNRNRARASSKSRLTDNGLYRMVCKLGVRIGMRARPHGIRHAAITTILDLTGGDLRLAQRFGRHRNPNTTILYDDHRRDAGGEAAKKLAEAAS